jgi:tRNA uridine 5-carboxymethylaminomethyl modification enzyme
VLADIGLRVERFKTGTPPRIDGRSVDLRGLARQEGDEGDYWFSFYERSQHPEQRACYLTWTGARLREIITKHLTESALYGGAISGRGPRYCPSIEDKVVKFPDAERHQVFLEPEGLDTTEMYVNGLSTPAAGRSCLPATVPPERWVTVSTPSVRLFPATADRCSRSAGSWAAFGPVSGTTGMKCRAG